jgi:nucleotide-binding universal stress UspA family protein
MFQKVLVPMDGSELAEHAISHVRSILREGSAGEVTLLHIKKIDLPPGFNPNMVRRPVFAAANKYLGEMESRMVYAGVKVKTKVLEAHRTATTITEYAQKNGMDLIVMSTHGYTGLKKLLLGSVAADVLSQSPVPVLMIRPEAHHL